MNPANNYERSRWEAENAVAQESARLEQQVQIHNMLDASEHFHQFDQASMRCRFCGMLHTDYRFTRRDLRQVCVAGRAASRDKLARIMEKAASKRVESRSKFVGRLFNE